MAVSVKTKDGKTVLDEVKTYMPYPQRFGRGDKMGRGPYEKSGIIEDTGLHPLKTQEERFEVVFPARKDGEASDPNAEELTVNVKLWYLPFGTRETTPFVWQDVTQKVKLNTSLD